MLWLTGCHQLKSISLACRSITTSVCYLKGNTRKPRVIASGTGSVSEKSKAKRESAKQLLAATNRKKWEESNQKLASLSGKLPTSNVYLSANFEQRHLSLSEAAECLREAAQPEMYDCLNNPLRAKFTLNMQTKKKTKFIQKFESHIVLPHLLSFLPRARVIALCKDADEAALALEAGAIHAGGAELFSRLEHGAFHWDEYDTVVAHSDWESTITKLRHVLKEKFPTLKNGRIGSDILALVHTYSDGVSMESTILEGVPEIAFLDVIIGQLTWENSRLETNLQAYFDAIYAGKSSRIVGDAVISVELHCPPTGERFPLDLTPFARDSEATKSSSNDTRSVIEDEVLSQQSPELSNELAT